MTSVSHLSQAEGRHDDAMVQRGISQLIARQLESKGHNSFTLYNIQATIDLLVWFALCSPMQMDFESQVHLPRVSIPHCLRLGRHTQDASQKAKPRNPWKKLCGGIQQASMCLELLPGPLAGSITSSTPPKLGQGNTICHTYGLQCRLLRIQTFFSQRCAVTNMHLISSVAS